MTKCRVCDACIACFLTYLAHGAIGQTVVPSIFDLLNLAVCSKEDLHHAVNDLILFDTFDCVFVAKFQFNGIAGRSNPMRLNLDWIEERR